MRMRSVVAALVGSHFLLGLLALAPDTSRLFTVPWLGALVHRYQDLDLAQSWAMFAPPPRDQDVFYVTALVDGNWTEPFAPLAPYVGGLRKPILPRGYYRMSIFFEAYYRFDANYSPTSRLAFYYQQLANYYCSGDGRIPRAKTVRFFMERRGLPDFRARERPVGRDAARAVYEQDCR